MTVFFAFSDETGQYRKNRAPKMISAHPYYIRSTVLFDGEDWITLNEHFRDVKKRYNIPENKEVKWSYIWSIKKDRNNKRNFSNKPYAFLGHLSNEKLLELINDSLGVMTKLANFLVIYTVTINDFDYTKRVKDDEIYRMHIMTAMQRIEMEIQNSDKNVAALFIDPENRKVNNCLRDNYNNIFYNSSQITEYRHIKDCLAFDKSDHSVGIQLADFCGGVFNSYLKGFENSFPLFNRINPFIRRVGNGLFGYGIMEVPTNQSSRTFIISLMQENELCFRDTEFEGSTDE